MVVFAHSLLSRVPLFPGFPPTYFLRGVHCITLEEKQEKVAQVYISIH